MIVYNNRLQNMCLYVNYNLFIFTIKTDIILSLNTINKQFSLLKGHLDIIDGHSMPKYKYCKHTDLKHFRSFFETFEIPCQSSVPEQFEEIYSSSVY